LELHVRRSSRQNPPCPYRKGILELAQAGDADGVGKKFGKIFGTDAEDVN
jgi:hypothetical protein